MSRQNFDKFINKEVKGAKKKEQLKQEKKQVKKEREAFFIEKKREQRALKKLQDEQQNRKTFTNTKSTDYSPKSAGSAKKWEKGGEESRDFNKDKKKLIKKSSFQKGEMDQSPAPNKRTEKSVIPGKANKVVPGNKKSNEFPVQQPLTGQKEGKSKSAFKKETKSSAIKQERNWVENRKDSHSKISKPASTFSPAPRKPFEKNGKTAISKAVPQKDFESKAGKPVHADAGQQQMPLNKYIAHCGVCSRRDAGEMVKSGKVTVNGLHITDPGTKVSPEDEVKIEGKKLRLKQTLVYILLNKPKDYITTAEDPQGRKTVLDIVKNATPERIYPVGRLDRNTSGVLLLTNDGDLAQQLTHPSFEVRKVYEAKLDKPLTKSDFTKLIEGVTLEDGFVQADSVAYADSKDKSVIGIEIHSGRNRVVRRMFEHLGYDVKGLDRVMFANLTKKNVDRGKWRFLNEKEVRLLKYFKNAKR